MFDRRLLAAVLALAATLCLPMTANAEGGYGVRIASLDPVAYPEVRIRASVADAQGKPMHDLKAADVVIRENGDVKRATVTLTSAVTPVRLVLALDTSGSMGGRPIADAKSAISALTKTLGPDDEAALITFNATVRIAQAPTKNKDLVVRATNAATAGGDTAIYDAVMAGAELLAAAPAGVRRALVLLTDGFDTVSRTDRGKAARRIGDLHFPLFAVGLGTDPDWGSLRELTDASDGGRVVSAPSSAQLTAIYASLGEQLASEYLITYSSTLDSAAGGTAAKVQVQIIRGGTLLAEVSTGYRVPPHATPVQPSAPPPVTVPAVTIDAPTAPPLLPPGLVGLIAGTAVLAFVAWLGEIARNWPDRQKRRLEVFVRSLTSTAPEHSKRRSIVQRVVGPSLRSIGGPILRFTPATIIEATRVRLEQAGEPMSIAPAEFIAVRFGVAMVGAIVGVAALVALQFAPPIAVAGAIPAAVLGYVVPGLFLDAIARSRTSAIRRALPAALDMLALSVEAGLSFDGAVAQVAQRWDTPLSDELRHLLLQFQMGRDRREVLRELGVRTGLVEVVRFGNAVVQADSFGAPLSKVLQEQAGEMRTHRRQRAEELARKAPVKMLFPLVLLIFPALFVIILGPAVPRLLVIFGSSF